MTIPNITEQRIRRALAKMFLKFPRSGSGAGVEGRLDAYAEALNGIPLKFVEEACDYAGRGKLGTPGFVPSAGEMYQLAQELLSREFRNSREERERRYKPEKVMDHTPEQKARLIAEFTQLLSDLKSGKRLNAPLNRKVVPFNPAAPTFKPYDRDMTQQEITRCVMAYRRGQDWKSLIPKDSAQYALINF